jgi:glycosyltransferase involved in cell wall biosynthesis
MSSDFNGAVVPKAVRRVEGRLAGWCRDTELSAMVVNNGEIVMREVGGRKIRVLHVLGGLYRGGIESWLIQTMRYVDRSRFTFDFALYSDSSRDLEGEAMSLGARIFDIGSPENPGDYLRKLRDLLRTEGPYDVVHSHLYDISGGVLAVARIERVPVRIAHSHNTHLSPDSSTFRRRVFPLMQFLVRQNATAILGCGSEAAEALSGRGAQPDAKTAILHCGIDLSRFVARHRPDPRRKELGIGDNDFVVGHVGRFEEQKNHEFLVRIARAAIDRADNIKFLLLGRGVLEPLIRSKVRDLGLGEHVIFAGLRDDVPDLMCNVMDAFLLPSLFEGLPLVLLEAQAAGMPCVVSDAVTRETDVVPGLFTRLSLDRGEDEWADALLRSRGQRRDLHQSLAIMAGTDFNADESTRRLQQFYEGRPVDVGEVALAPGVLPAH